MVTYSSLCLYWKWPKKIEKYQQFSIIMAGFCLTFVYGSVYTYGNIDPYLVSYIRERSHPSDLRYERSTYLFSCQYSFCAISFVTSGLLEKILGMRMCTICAGILTTVGLGASFIVVRYSFWLLFIFFGILYPMGLGIGYFLGLFSIAQWITPDRTGLAMGVVASGIGIGGLILDVLQTAFVNTYNKRPYNAPYEEFPSKKYFTQNIVLDKVPYLFLIEVAIFLMIYLFSSVFMVYPTTHSKPEQELEKRFLKWSICSGYIQKIKATSITKNVKLH